MISKDNEIMLKRIVDFLFEVGMLKKTPRTGYQFLGSGKENVAEHSYRTAIIGFVLGLKENLDWKKIVLMCLFHDLHEARTGDFNYVYRRYNRAKEDKAILDALEDTGLEDYIIPLLKELEEVKTKEAEIAHDADQLDLILNLKEQHDLGNPYAEKWLKYALERLRTDAAKTLAQKIIETDHTDWWFERVDKSWWVKNYGKN
jgi:putative hydrolase of HD superfamily